MLQPEMAFKSCVASGCCVVTCGEYRCGLAYRFVVSVHGLIPTDTTAYDVVMVFHGRVHGGVVVLDNGEQLPEGARVAVIPETASEPNDSRTCEISPEEHARVLQILDRIAALPIEGMTDPFSGADHDRVLYGAP